MTRLIFYDPVNKNSISILNERNEFTLIIMNCHSKIIAVGKNRPNIIECVSLSSVII